MTEIIAMLTKKQNLSPEPTETIGLTFSEMETFPSRTKGVKKRNLTTSSVLHSFIVTGGSPPWKLSSRKLTLHLINGAQINVSRNYLHENLHELSAKMILQSFVFPVRNRGRFGPL